MEDENDKEEDKEGAEGHLQPGGGQPAVEGARRVKEPKVNAPPPNYNRPASVRRRPSTRAPGLETAGQPTSPRLGPQVELGPEPLTILWPDFLHPLALRLLGLLGLLEQNSTRHP